MNPELISTIVACTVTLLLALFAFSWRLSSSMSKVQSQNENLSNAMEKVAKWIDEHEKWGQQAIHEFDARQNSLDNRIVKLETKLEV